MQLRINGTGLGSGRTSLWRSRSFCSHKRNKARLLDSFTQLYRDLATRANDTAQQSMCRGSLSIMFYCNVQVLQLVVPELAYNVLQQWNTRVLRRQRFHLFELANE
ncbi:hypothetical protein MVEN_02077200 [Mycena venus]|uniref:Uncharacterized protein n=1 Tax=Mycena venus TaxID=2733690 RepID=A0A8H6XDC2_9AGAR|nr:hypothetical protein MVEN_02077200 [Mycena venus]